MCDSAGFRPASGSHPERTPGFPPRSRAGTIRRTNVMKLSQVASRLETPVYALLRFITGALFSVHGMQKLLGWFGASARPAFPSQLWFGGVIELVGGVLIALGLFTRGAAFVASGMMAVAYFQFHWKLNMAANGWLPQVNKGELAVLYCWIFLFIMARGPGAVAIDNLRKGKRGR